MHDMSYREMVSMMQMDDTARFGMVLVERLEWRRADDAIIDWDAQAWYGGDYNKVFFKTEGERVDGRTENARAELLWDRIFARRWSVQLGAREDFAAGPSRTWAAIGVKGLAPYWFEIDAALYVGDAGRTAARIRVDYDLLLTQRCVLRAEMEGNLYGQADRELNISSGLNDLEVGLRLRYEFRREIAPYLGVAWRYSSFVELPIDGASSNDIQFLAGLRIWF